MNFVPNDSYGSGQHQRTGQAEHQTRPLQRLRRGDAAKPVSGHHQLSSSSANANPDDFVNVSSVADQSWVERRTCGLGGSVRFRRADSDASARRYTKPQTRSVRRSDTPKANPSSSHDASESADDEQTDETDHEWRIVGSRGQTTSAPLEPCTGSSFLRRRPLHSSFVSAQSGQRVGELHHPSRGYRTANATIPMARMSRSLASIDVVPHNSARTPMSMATINGG